MRAALDAKPETVVLVDEEGRPTKRPRKTDDESGVSHLVIFFQNNLLFMIG